MLGLHSPLLDTFLFRRFSGFGTPTNGGMPGRPVVRFQTCLLPASFGIPTMAPWRLPASLRLDALNWNCLQFTAWLSSCLPLGLQTVCIWKTLEAIIQSETMMIFVHHTACAGKPFPPCFCGKAEQFLPTPPKHEKPENSEKLPDSLQAHTGRA